MFRAFAAASIAIVGGLSLAGGAVAECDGPPPLFAETVATAKQIVIGDVVAVRPADGLEADHSTRFTVQVSHVVRGQQLAQMNVNDALMQPCAGNIVAGVGDRIALALNATAFTPAIPANGVAWIDGPAPEGLETTTVEQVYKLAGVPMPAPGPAAPTPEVTLIWVGPLIWGLVVGVVLVMGAVVARRVVAAR